MTGQVVLQVTDGSGGVAGDGSGGVAGDALPVAVDSSHDEREASQVPPKRKRRQLSEADRKFSCTECDQKYGHCIPIETRSISDDTVLIMSTS